jgi:CheY-like chemotaxis protein
MPVMDGFDAARAIHSHPAGKGAVIVAVSASVFEEERKWLKECGVEWFLPKPFLEAELFQMVEKCLGLSFETTKADTDIEPTR